MGGPEAALQGGAAGEWRGGAGGPAVQDVAQERRLFLVTPWQDMRAGVVARPGQARREADGVADQAPAVRDEWRPGAPGGALGRERGARVPVCEAELDLACGSGGVVFGPARGKRCTGRREGERLDGKAHEAIIVAQGGNTRPFIARKAHGDGLSVAPGAQGAAPRLDRFRALREHQTLPAGSASGLYADIGGGIGPVEAHKGRTCFRDW
jgi:hypothetical protein